MVTSLRILWSVILVVFLIHTVLGDQTEKSQNASNESCNKQRKILTSPSGLFSDGSGDYPEDSHCEWLIKANKSQQYITLTFLEMETECSYDHVFVYSGDSYNSPLLGSFSGSTLPPPITVQSDAMLVLLYSDTNYVRNGFTAVYNITDCPLECSEKGQCIDNTCQCEQLWTGEACDIPLCPNDCGINEHTGDCDRYLDPPQCICNKGYSGESCSLPESNQNGGNSWHLLTRDKTDLSPRAGLAGAYLSHVDRFYLFGGFTFGKLLEDLLAYDFAKNKWLKPLVQNGPSPRSGHAVSIYAKNFALYGGEMENGILSDELWLYNVAKEEWHLEAEFSKIRPPALTKHSLTLVEGKWLYLFGGSLQDGSFSSAMYRINLNEGAQWEKIEPTGGKELERRIVGHSAVYHGATKSLFVYGGIMVDYARFSRLSNQIHAFHIEKRYWTHLAYPKRGNYTPLERAFHSAAIVGDYLVVYGGYTHLHSHQELCYDNEIYLYHLGCHRWVNFATLNITNSSRPNPITQGVFAHTMGVRKGHTLLIAGGYSGMTRGSFLAYVLPPVVTTRGQQLSASACSRHKSRESCSNYTSCTWCSQNSEEFCLEVTEKDKCKSGTFSASSCPGLCPALEDCHSCLIWGEPSGPNAIGNTDTMDPFLQPTCSWCVQAAQCHPIHDPPEICRPSYKGAHSRSELNWWGPNGTNITTVVECRIKDFRSGLALLKYRHPINWKQPDELSYINQTVEDLRIQTEFSREREGLGGGINMARFLGFIHPLGAKPLLKNASLQMSMDFSGGRAIFRMSNDSTREHLELIANRTGAASKEKSLYRPNGQPLFPVVSPGHKYLMDFTMILPVAYNESSAMQLKWNAFSTRENVIKISHLEPYRNGSCHQYQNCLACLSDAACGWCQQKLKCVQRLMIDSHYPFCHGSDKYIITIPENCPLCSNYIYCEDCAKVNHCEWLVEEAHCGRRGRFEDAVRHPDLCPNPCHLRSNCTSCLGDPGRCAWCEETHSCFLFATYTTSFMFGRCREWVDEDRSTPSGVTTPGAQCRDCSRHSDCTSCLKDLSCGWCGNRRNPIDGVCIQGDFSGPYFGECEAFVAQAYPTILPSEPADWSYSSCPDVEECWLGLHNCHPNATCTNTLGSYICTCNKGFKITGNICTRTCSTDCIHGNCSEAPDYTCHCDLGWTGPDCSINCGCNNHSNCTRGVALCDECQDWTEGQFCERCRPGSFGNATNTTGCKECNCNGHGDASVGYCNSTTGHCYCLHNTEGHHCEVCKVGYYGDPRNNGHCYAECQTRGVITNVQEGLLGSQAGVTVPSNCLWILTVHSALNRTLRKDSFKMTKASIELTILPDMKIKCPHNYLYVYDGFPKFISDHHGKLLGSYCGINVSKPVIVVATSGLMTIYFKRTDPAHGFNATYHRLECPHSCSAPNRICHAGRCQCKHNFAGPTCDNEICPNKCSSHLGHGECQQMYGICLCYNGYGGKDCSITTNNSHLLWTTLFDPETLQSSRSHLAENLPRIGHSLLASECSGSSTSGCLWIFGGYSSIHGNMNDLFKFEIRHNTWEKVKMSSHSEGPPPERRFHCSTMAAGHIYIYGGIGKNEVFGDFWKFSVSQRVWIQLATMAELPALAGSSLTMVEEEKLILIGGFSYNYGFFEKVVEYNTKRKEWQIFNCSGAAPVGIYGHTASYHPLTKSLYIYGGVIYNADHATVSSGLYALHYPSGKWSKLPSTNAASPIEVKPLATALHAAAITDNYLVIIGGRDGKNNEAVSKAYAYLFKCNLWLSLDNERIKIIGHSVLPMAGISAVWWSGHIYAFGGFNGQMSGHLTRLTIPSDLCYFFSKKRSDCIQYTGCSYCSVYENGINQTFCYSQHGIIPSSCYNPKGASEVTPGTACTTEWLEKRDCYQYTSCVDCIASWPSHLDAKQVCQWCSNCQDGRCIPAGTSCEEQNDCKVPQRVVVHPSSCPMRVCLASDCDKCSSMPICMWTRQVVRSSEWRHTLNAKPIFDWTCIRKMMQDGSTFAVESMPPLTCPPRCSQHRNCSTCLDSAGGEGGWHECRWSEMLEQCLSPSFELLLCESGSCGAMLQGSSSSCPVPCWQHTQAAHCLSYPNCGWCAFSGQNVNGRGLCMKGGILKSTGGSCNNFEVQLTGRSLPDNVSRWLIDSEGPVSWSYIKRPPENECLNNHHTCNEDREECFDKKDGFECKCKTGYTLVDTQCNPHCSQGCFFGTCVKPDTCKCNFGYVGSNCSIQCDCNGHSNCRGPLHLSSCSECYNNTQGPQCQQCKPFFVGNPINGGKCIPCHEYCNGHSDVCLGELPTNASVPVGNVLQLHKHLLSLYPDYVKEGPKENAICYNCKNNTEGDRCDQCVQGFFKEGENIKDGCRPCECHGHGDMCNVLNGENCNCQNNTENDRQCNNKNSKNMVTPCWKLQCSKCKEYFLGVPTHGHQCYRHMFLDKDYCFDPNTQEECNRKPAPLIQGRTVFFAVQPRYMNVDIRIIVDVTEGGADFYLSAKEDTFVVDVNKSTGIHYVSIDRKYGIDINSDVEFYQLPLIVKDSKMSKREVKLEDATSDSTNSNDSYVSSPLKFHEARGRGLTTYITITDPQEFLCVRRLQNRLVITIPQEVYDLRSTRFHMLLYGVGNKNTDATYGSLFFRQDQTRIDLFVFFSVFFSCFFLFLAICVVIWKVKQAFDVRRARRLHAAEMKHMASRPFSSIIMAIEDEPDEYYFYPYSPSNFRKKHKYKGHLGRDSPKVYSDDRYGTRPIAIEPISDGIAAVVTVLVQLPGGLSAPVRLSLGSSLITVRGLSSHGNIGIRAPRRRRASHVTL